MAELVRLHTKGGSRSASQGDAHASRFLPTTRAEMEARGWDELDILIVTGDAYVDHPAFGPVLIARFLEGRGYKVGVIAQPSWSSPDDIARMGSAAPLRRHQRGQPRLDAEQAHRAEEDARRATSTRPDGGTSARPNRATLVYSNLCRQAFPGVPIVLGGIEASLRRIAHYDYWSEPGPPLDPPRREGATSSSSAWASAPRGRSRAASTPASTVKSLTDIRGTAHVKKKPARRGSRSSPRPEQVRHRRQARRAPVLRGGEARQEGVRAHEPPVPVRDEPAQRAPAAAGARRRGGLLQSPARAAAREGDGRRSTISRSRAARTRATRERASRRSRR